VHLLTVDGAIKASIVKNVASCTLLRQNGGNYVGSPFPPGTYSYMATAEAFSKTDTQGDSSGIYITSFSIFPGLNDNKYWECESDCKC
jgi:hypothetical protein